MEDPQDDRRRTNLLMDSGKEKGGVMGSGEHEAKEETGRRRKRMIWKGRRWRHSATLVRWQSGNSFSGQDIFTLY